MPDIGSAIGGGQLISGLMGSDAAGDAADAQRAASEAAIKEQREAREQMRADLMPWTTGGGLAQNELLRRLGLGGNNLNTGGVTTPTQTAEQIRAELLGQYTKGGLDPTVYANFNPALQMLFAGALKGEVDEAGLQAAINARLAQQGQGGGPGVDDGQYGSLLRPFGQQDLDNDLVYQNGLQFGLDQGVNQLNNRAAAAGGYGSGAALKALTRYGNDYATTKTAGAYDRTMANKNQQYSFLQGASAQGQSAAAQTGAAGINTAAGIAGNINAAGNAQAAGIVGGSNALTSGLAGATNAFQWNQLLNQGSTNPQYNQGYGSNLNSFFYGNGGSGD